MSITRIINSLSKYKVIAHTFAHSHTYTILDVRGIVTDNWLQLRKKLNKALNSNISWKLSGLNFPFPCFNHDYTDFKPVTCFFIKSLKK